MKRILLYLLLITLYIAIPAFTRFVYPTINLKLAFCIMMICNLILNITLIVSILKIRFWKKILFGIITLPIAMIFAFILRKIDLQNFGIKIDKSIIIFFFLGFFSVLISELIYQLYNKKT